MFDVLTFLFEQYDDPSSCPGRDDLTRELEAAGFESEEIGDALDWFDGIRPEAFAGLKESGGVRIYSDYELELLSCEVRGFICFLEDNGALDAAQRELVIDRLLALPSDEISPAVVRLVALLVLWREQAELPLLVGEELLSAVHGEPTMQ
ncbi:DUF494 family protein [Crenobacter intestini]|uniref:Protein Smg homolog n=1 Tax=Crenobacter intestini TaxID=2563443 RepID=A0A4T0V3J7_9NEIS|nr:DUF494 domain-containing protein [Crenobacter intestini]TIC86214.1 DUF494 domain-containing protein [Crenobacter intestini]